MPTQTTIYSEDFLQPAEAHDADAQCIFGRLKASTTFPKGCLVTDGSVPGEYHPYDSAVTLVNTPKGLLKRACITDANGSITFGTATGGMDHGQTYATAAIYIGGTFRTADLPQTGTGALDATAIGSTKQFAKLVKGSLSAGLLKLL